MIQSLLFFCFLLPLVFIIFKPKSKFKSKSDERLAPKSYPFIGSYLSIYTNRHRLIQWTSDAVHNSPNFTFLLRRPFGQSRIITGNPTVVQHILKTQFSTYQKGGIFRDTLFDLLGDGIFNVDGDAWKFQRQLSSHEFNTKSLRHFVEHVVDSELNERLLPILTTAAANETVLDLQDILQRFAFDNICKIAFGYDPGYLTPSLPDAKFAVAFEDAVRISSERFRMITPLLWKIQRLYPPVPIDTKAATVDDVFPDGTDVKKGMVVSYHPYAMGRMETLWGGDYIEFRPERWLKKDEREEKMRFVPRDPYTYPVFQAGPRICLGKDMAFLQMKRVVAGVLRQFKVVPVVNDGSEPVFVGALTSKMKGGFPVKIKERK
ncbi:hypothetical protein E3N88_33853 [Mikania micrantha]|uniref:Cytochrome P450 n=1 Tax=Mikania micrantha TaxID=192012 RepID=A0A5N6MD07_9ASTR|nr:hypothetical protein E3N88_33853 [Mikania micrantha]